MSRFNKPHIAVPHSDGSGRCYCGKSLDDDQIHATEAECALFIFDLGFTIAKKNGRPVKNRDEILKGIARKLGIPFNEVRDHYKPKVQEIIERK